MSDRDLPAAERAEHDRLMEAGGPAFPVGPICLHGRAVFSHPGMSLRDWMAGQALSVVCHMGQFWDRNPDDLAAFAYEIADAMLRARKKS